MSKENLLRELIHKSWHRGCKETDILLGYFARAKLHEASDDFLVVYQQLINEPDWDIYAWLTGEAETPQRYVEIVGVITNFHESLHDGV
jgi:antitoxin CptB